VSKNKFIRGICLTAVVGMIPFSQAQAEASWGLTGWINEGVTFFDDGDSSDIVQVSDNGTTLGSRLTFAGSADLPNTSLTSGFEVIVEPQSPDSPLIFSNQDANVIDPGSPAGITEAGAPFSDTNNRDLNVLGTSVYVGGPFGKVTVGLQSMPTDNIAVLADPSLTLWSSISPVFRANGFSIRGSGTAYAAVPTGAVAGVTNVWGAFMNCLTAPGLQGPGGIGLDCNGIYRSGVRYDLPTFIDGLGIAVGYANDDVYDVAAKWNGELARLKAILHLGYAVNQGPAAAGTTPGANYDEAENFQVQGGLMDPVTGLFGTVAYQLEDADFSAAATAAATAAGGDVADDTDAWWLKVGIKKAFTQLGDTSLAFQYGSYNDQYDGIGFAASALGVTGSEVERIGVEVNQYFGSKLIIYGVWENLDLDVDGTAAAQTIFGGSDDVNTFTLGLTYFF